MRRRAFILALGSVGLAGLSGTLGTDDGYIRPDGDPVPTPFDCEQAGFEPHHPGYDNNHLHWGDTEDASLRINGVEFAYGDTAEITLQTNSRGVDEKWNFELLTDEGWRDVRGTTDDEARLKYELPKKTSTAEWAITLTEEGIIRAGGNQDVLEICPTLVSGRYRFVYWGLSGESVAVSFDMTV